MNHTPQEVISLYEKHEELLKGCSTSLQKDELRAELEQELHCVQWEVEVSDVSDGVEAHDFVIEGKVNVTERSRWGRVGYSEMRFTAYLDGKNDKDLRGRLLTLKSGQRVRVEGTIHYWLKHFTMQRARLMD